MMTLVLLAALALAFAYGYGLMSRLDRFLSPRKRASDPATRGKTGAPAAGSGEGTVPGAARPLQWQSILNHLFT